MERQYKYLRLCGIFGIVSIMAVSIYIAETKALNKLTRAGIYIFASWF